MDPAGPSFECPRCKQQHPKKEIGFNLPDVALGKTANAVNEDVFVLEDRLFFVRGWMPVKVDDGSTFGIGFWVQLSKNDFADFEKHNRVAHSTYNARIANQALFLAPTLGVSAQLEPRVEGLRPLVRLADPEHPLNKMGPGVSRALVNTWMSEGFHLGEPEALGRPFLGTWETHGWSVVDPYRAGKMAIPPSEVANVGDNAKIIFQLNSADAGGNPSVVGAALWVRVDFVQAKAWSGTVQNEVRVPSTLAFGSRVWFQQSNVIELERRVLPNA